MKERWPYPKAPWPNWSLWPLNNQLELNWIICLVRAMYPNGRAHEQHALFRKCFSESPEYVFRAQAELYSLLTAWGREFNHIVFDKNEDYPTNPDGPWPFLYWSYFRRNMRRTGASSFEYDIGQYFIGGADQFYLDRMLRFHKITLR